MTTVTFTSSGTFTVPAYSTMTVEVLGGHGTTGANVVRPGADGDPDVTYPGGTGGAGGRSFKSYTFGAGPAPGASVSIVIGLTSRFTSGTYPTADSGANGQDASIVSDGDSTLYYAGLNGADGAASGGDTNTTGGSSETSPKIVITYTAPTSVHLAATATDTASATGNLRATHHLGGAAADVASATANLRDTHHLAGSGAGQGSGSAALDVQTPGASHLTGAASAAVTALGGLRVTHHLAGTALGIGGASAVLINRAHLAAQATVQATLAAALRTAAANVKHMDGSAQAAAASTASLSAGIPIMSVLIANMALDLLEEEPIVTETDDRAPVRWMARNFGPIRDAMLRAHPWNFAIRRTTLTRLDDAPAYGWSSAYTAPSDCLRLLPLTGDYQTGADLPYTLEGQTILANGTSPIRLLYVARVVDDTKMDPIFVQALAATLAARAANFITGKQSYAKYCEEMAERLTQQAQMVDALEGTPYNPQGEDWINGRQGVDVGGTYY